MSDDSRRIIENHNQAFKGSEVFTRARNFLNCWSQAEEIPGQVSSENQQILDNQPLSRPNMNRDSSSRYFAPIEQNSKNQANADNNAFHREVGHPRNVDDIGLFNQTMQGPRQIEVPPANPERSGFPNGNGEASLNPFVEFFYLKDIFFTQTLQEVAAQSVRLNIRPERTIHREQILNSNADLWYDQFIKEKDYQALKRLTRSLDQAQDTLSTTHDAIIQVLNTQGALEANISNTEPCQWLLKNMDSLLRDLIPPWKTVLNSIATAKLFPASPSPYDISYSKECQKRIVLAQSNIQNAVNELSDGISKDTLKRLVNEALSELNCILATGRLPPG